MTMTETFDGKCTGNFAGSFTFTGTLIEDLMATVERVEQQGQEDSGPILVEGPRENSWFVSVHDNREHQVSLPGVA